MSRNKRNVADYETVKSVLFTEYNEFLRTVMTLRWKGIDNSRPQEYEEALMKAKNHLFFISNIGGASRNLIPSEDGEEDNVIDMIKDIQGKDYDYSDSEEAVKDFERVSYKLSQELGDTGFLDTRLDDDKYDTSEDLEKFFLDKKPAIYDR